MNEVFLLRILGIRKSKYRLVTRSVWLMIQSCDDVTAAFLAAQANALAEFQDRKDVDNYCIENLVQLGGEFIAGGV